MSRGGASARIHAALVSLSAEERRVLQTSIDHPFEPWDSFVALTGLHEQRALQLLSRALDNVTLFYARLDAAEARWRGLVH